MFTHNRVGINVQAHDCPGCSVDLNNVDCTGNSRHGMVIQGGGNNTYDIDLDTVECADNGRHGISIVSGWWDGNTGSIFDIDARNCSTHDCGHNGFNFQVYDFIEVDAAIHGLTSYNNVQNGVIFTGWSYSSFCDVMIENSQIENNGNNGIVFKAADESSTYDFGVYSCVSARNANNGLLAISLGCLTDLELVGNDFSFNGDSNLIFPLSTTASVQNVSSGGQPRNCNFIAPLPEVACSGEIMENGLYYRYTGNGLFLTSMEGSYVNLISSGNSLAGNTGCGFLFDTAFDPRGYVRDSDTGYIHDCGDFLDDNSCRSNSDEDIMRIGYKRDDDIRIPEPVPVVTFMPLYMTNLEKAQELWAAIQPALGDTPSSEVQAFLDAASEHMANASSGSNYIFMSGELQKAIVEMQNAEALL